MSYHIIYNKLKSYLDNHSAIDEETPSFINDETLNFSDLTDFVVSKFNDSVEETISYLIEKTGYVVEQKGMGYVVSLKDRGILQMQHTCKNKDEIVKDLLERIVDAYNTSVMHKFRILRTKNYTGIYDKLMEFLNNNYTILDYKTFTIDESIDMFSLANFVVNHFKSINQTISYLTEKTGYVVEQKPEGYIVFCLDRNKHCQVKNCTNQLDVVNELLTRIISDYNASVLIVRQLREK